MECFGEIEAVMCRETGIGKIHVECWLTIYGPVYLRVKTVRKCGSRYVLHGAVLLMCPRCWSAASTSSMRLVSAQHCWVHTTAYGVIIGRDLPSKCWMHQASSFGISPTSKRHLSIVRRRHVQISVFTRYDVFVRLQLATTFIQQHSNKYKTEKLNEIRDFMLYTRAVR